jgi:isopenicillin N synthase-like dioxygenase
MRNFLDPKVRIAYTYIDFERRKEEITEQLVEAAENAGFLTLVDHGISVDEIEAQFAISRAFFGLSLETKGKTPHSRKTNNGWEYMVRLLEFWNVELEI